MWRPPRSTAPSVTAWSSRPSYSPIHPAVCLHVRVSLASTGAPALAFHLPSICSTAQKHTYSLHDNLEVDIGLCLIHLVVPSPDLRSRPLPRPTNATHLATCSLYVHQTLEEYPLQTVSRTSSTTRFTDRAVAPSGYFTFDYHPQYINSCRDNEPLGS